MGDAEQPIIRGPGQPTTLTDQVQTDLVLLIENGINERGACAQQRIPWSTYYGWLARGRNALTAARATRSEVPEKELVYVEFLDAIMRAREGLQTRIEDRLRQTIKDMTPRDALEALSRIDRKRWARKDTLTVEHTGSVEVTSVYAAQIAQLLQGILGELQLSKKQLAAAPEIVSRHLHAVGQSDMEATG